MRILVVAPIFLNTRRVASQRARALAEVLAQRGNAVTVLTAAVEEEESPPPPGLQVLEARALKDTYGKAGSDLPLGTRGLVLLSVLPTEPLAAALRLLQMGPAPRGVRTWAQSRFDALNTARFSTANTVKGLLEGSRWARDAYATFRESDEGAYDVVFSTFGPFASIWVAQKAMRAGLAKFWVADFRDPVAKSKTFPWVQGWRLASLRRAMRGADLVTAVSKGVRKSLLSARGCAQCADKTYVLTNGFLKRAAGEESATPDPSVVKIAYVGQLYAEKSRPEMLFEGLKAATEKDPATSFEFHYAGGQSALVRELAQEAGVEGALIDHGFVSHEDALKLQHEADALLVLAWNEVGNEGVLSAKFFEYMGARKPMIALVSGRKPGSELAEMVEDLRLGVAAEYVEGAAGTAKIARFLEDLAAAKRVGKPLYEADERRVAEFDYRNIAKRLESLIETRGERPRRKRRWLLATGS